jgi:nitroreductase
MLELKNLLNRKTVKNFLKLPSQRIKKAHQGRKSAVALPKQGEGGLAKKIDAEILENATRVAWRTPTSLNSKPVILLDISKHCAEDWISAQPAVATAPHLFLLATNPDQGEKNAREFLDDRYGSEVDDARVNETMQRIVADKEVWAVQQVYLTAGYFAATLEASGVSGCFIAGFDKVKCAKNVELPDGYTPELIFACGYADPENDGSHETESARKFEDFYFPESAVT